MARSTRTRWLKAVALVVALASLTINYGLIDLIDGYTGYIDQARNQVLDAGWGLVFGVVIPLGLLAQLPCPRGAPRWPLTPEPSRGGGPGSDGDPSVAAECEGAGSREEDRQGCGSSAEGRVAPVEGAVGALDR